MNSYGVLTLRCCTCAHSAEEHSIHGYCLVSDTLGPCHCQALVTDPMKDFLKNGAINGSRIVVRS